MTEGFFFKPSKNKPHQPPNFTFGHRLNTESKIGIQKRECVRKWSVKT